jgi:hypothetical protein
MKTLTQYHGKYRNIGYQIRHWEDRWAAYILLSSHQTTFAHRPLLSPSGQFCGHSYREDVALYVLSDATHGGITLYDVTTHPGDDTEYYQFGWDYSHYWDMGRHYDEKIIYCDVVDVIDRLWQIKPDMRVYCSMVGGYHALSDGYETADGGFISNEGLRYCEENDLCIPARADREGG